MGLPRDLDGGDTEVTGQARRFARQLGSRYRLTVHMIDERLTSMEARSQLGRAPKTIEELDAVAARLILKPGYVNEIKLYQTAAAVDKLIEQVAAALRSRLAAVGIDDPVIIGIHTGGAWLAERLHHALGIDAPLGTLDISFYRDDYTRIGMNPQVRPSRIPFRSTTGISSWWTMCCRRDAPSVPP